MRPTINSSPKRERLDILPLLKTTIRILLLPGLTQTAVSFAANREILELQRDVAVLQHDLRSLQRSLDQGLGGTRRDARQRN